jgi:hypothetical protein
MFLVLIVALGVTALDVLPKLRGLPWYELFVIPVVWLALWSAEDDVLPVTAMAIIVNILALLPSIVFHGSTARAALVERGIVIGTIWLTVMIALLRKRARRTYKWINLLGGR